MNMEDILLDEDNGIEESESVPMRRDLVWQ